MVANKGLWTCSLDSSFILDKASPETASTELPFNQNFAYQQAQREYIVRTRPITVSIQIEFKKQKQFPDHLSFAEYTNSFDV